MYFMLYINILLIVNMKTFYMHHYLCIVQCVDEKKKIRCTLLNINAKQRNAKIKKKVQITFFVHSVLYLVILFSFFSLDCLFVSCIIQIRLCEWIHMLIL